MKVEDKVDLYLRCIEHDLRILNKSLVNSRAVEDVHDRDLFNRCRLLLELF